MAGQAGAKSAVSAGEGVDRSIGGSPRRSRRGRDARPRGGVPGRHRPSSLTAAVRVVSKLGFKGAVVRFDRVVDVPLGDMKRRRDSLPVDRDRNHLPGKRKTADADAPKGH